MPSKKWTHDKKKARWVSPDGLYMVWLQAKPLDGSKEWGAARIGADDGPLRPWITDTAGSRCDAQGLCKKELVTKEMVDNAFKQSQDLLKPGEVKTKNVLGSVMADPVTIKRFRPYCVWLSDGTKIVIRREPADLKGKVWMEVADQAVLHPAEAKASGHDEAGNRVPEEDMAKRIQVALENERKLGAGHSYRVVRFIAGTLLADQIDPVGSREALTSSTCSKDGWCRPMRALLGRESYTRHGIEPFVVHGPIKDDSGRVIGQQERLVGLQYKRRNEPKGTKRKSGRSLRAVQCSALGRGPGGPGSGLQADGDLSGHQAVPGENQDRREGHPRSHGSTRARVRRAVPVDLLRLRERHRHPLWSRPERGWELPRSRQRHCAAAAVHRDRPLHRPGPPGPAPQVRSRG
jgi:hypothetical protein